MKTLSESTVELLRSPSLTGTIIIVPESAPRHELAQLFLDLSVHYLEKKGGDNHEKEISKEENGQEESRQKINYF